MKPLLSVVLLLSWTAIAHAQEEEVRWQRQQRRAESRPDLFHATKSLNLPTAETVQKGGVQFDISHRFLPPLSEGTKGLWGLDGPAHIRFALGYALTNSFMVTLARSNEDDNLDLELKYGGLAIENDWLPLMLGLVGGASWNTDVAGRTVGDHRNFQFYGQLVVNTVIDDRLGIGFVPSFVHNAVFEEVSATEAFSWGFYAHYYVSDLLALLAEWNVSDSLETFPYNAASIGFQLETGGHFFKIFLTNATSLNASQFLPGASNRFAFDELRLAFNTVRLLH